MRPKAARFIVLGIAIAAGGGAAMLVNGRQPEVTNTKPDTVEVLIAKADLGAGQAIGDKDIGWQTWLTAAANASFIRATQRPDAVRQFVGAIVRVPIATGQPINDAVASILKPGTRAVSVDFSPTSENRASFQPDERVDVILTRRDKATQRAAGVESVSEKVLEDVRVLAVAVGKSAIIESTPEQAEKVEQSRQLGTLSLVLHSNDDWRGPFNVVRYGVSTLTRPPSLGGW
jgi:pilus assembly protein CpaB